MSLDDEIDRLYQLPIGEFTAARNRLAKEKPNDRGAISALRKPNVPAWVVNQLYWRRRPVYDRLAKAAARAQSGHVRAVSGRPTDVRDVDEAHADALHAAMSAAREVLTDSGEGESPATLTAIHETLQAITAIDQPGRLVHPLKPLGFEAFAELLGASSRAKLSLVPKTTPQPVAAASPARAAAAARRAIAAAEKVAAQAREAERRALASLTRARQSLASAERKRAQLTSERDRLLETLERQSAEIGALVRAVKAEEQAVARATNERERTALALGEARNGQRR
jgi:hypothetical protein